LSKRVVVGAVVLGIGALLLWQLWPTPAGSPADEVAGGAEVGVGAERGARPGPPEPSPRPLPRDPGTVEGKPGPLQNAPAEARRRLANKPLTGDLNTARGQRTYPEPALIPPEVPVRAPGVPPTPQGAGINARKVALGEDAVAVPPATEAEVEATNAAYEEFVEARRAAIAACFAGALPPLWLTVEEIGGPDGRAGFVSKVDDDEGEALDGALEDCVLTALDGPMPAPAGQRSVVVRVE